MLTNSPPGTEQTVDTSQYICPSSVMKQVAWKVEFLKRSPGYILINDYTPRTHSEVLPNRFTCGFPPHEVWTCPHDPCMYLDIGVQPNHDVGRMRTDSVLMVFRISLNFSTLIACRSQEPNGRWCCQATPSRNRRYPVGGMGGSSQLDERGE